MMILKRRRFFSFAFGAVFGWASKGLFSTALAGTVQLAQAASKLTTIGRIRDIRLSGFGTPPERQRLLVRTQDTVFRNEVMETVDGGAMHILFRDETSLRLGSESLVVLDEYIYAPFKATKSQMTIALTKGVFRFVSGKMKKASYRIVTPTAYIGVRGTDFLATVTDDSTVIDLYDGEIEVEDTRGGDDTVAPVAVAAGQSITLSPASAVPTIGVATPPSDQALAGPVGNTGAGTSSEDAGGGEDREGAGESESTGCFPAGTKITMGDGSLKSIEDVEVDDMVLAFDFDINEPRPARVCELIAPVREGVYVLNDGLLRLTDNHPVFVMKHGREHWVSLNPEMTMRETKLDDVALLEQGDAVLTLNVFALEGLASDTLQEIPQHSFSTQFTTIEEISYVEGDIQTYNLKSVEGLCNFFADGVLVHNKTD